MNVAFMIEPVPERGALHPIHPGISRIVADNPGRMTYHGTNTYLIEDPDGVTVLDPGPDQPGHVANILRLTPGPIVRILLSHTHRDHLGALGGLKAETGAPTYGWHKPDTDAFAPDVSIHDGDTVAGMQAIFTPGHAADHVCFARPDGVLFSADHVMSWSSSVVSPPGGDMAAYFASLNRLLDRPTDTIYFPGHGPPMGEPHAYVAALLEHRVARERAIATALKDGPRSSTLLVDVLYSKIDPILKMAAERNVLAHLIKLEREGLVVRRGDEWRSL
ncbi:MBL fold metallo-hydrolase [Acidisphaera sp. L21]|uniref:MBL fold metallo-hydrolase n=1 Tax=Acidisphaera sp. L21 TaxID=1641851 RepID=UPI0020B1117B|nr:MBL fold metallo-hydrolase [Acidisphaera sp. L21]